MGGGVLFDRRHDRRSKAAACHGRVDEDATDGGGTRPFPFGRANDRRAVVARRPTRPAAAGENRAIGVYGNEMLTLQWTNG